MGFTSVLLFLSSVPMPNAKSKIPPINSTQKLTSISLGNNKAMPEYATASMIKSALTTPIMIYKAFLNPYVTLLWIRVKKTGPKPKLNIKPMGMPYRKADMEKLSKL